MRRPGYSSYSSSEVQIQCKLTSSFRVFLSKNFVRITILSSQPSILNMSTEWLLSMCHTVISSWGPLALQTLILFSSSPSRQYLLSLNEKVLRYLGIPRFEFKYPFLTARWPSDNEKLIRFISPNLSEEMHQKVPSLSPAESYDVSTFLRQFSSMMGESMSLVWQMNMLLQWCSAMQWLKSEQSSHLKGISWSEFLEAWQRRTRCEGKISNCILNNNKISKYIKEMKQIQTGILSFLI